MIGRRRVPFLGPLLAVPLVACGNHPPAPPAATSTAPVVASPWRVELVGPVYDWPEPDGRWFVTLKWQLRHEGAGAPAFLAGAEQTLRVRGAGQTLLPSMFGGTLPLDAGGSAPQDAMFHQTAPGTEPSGVSLEVEIRGSLVARLPLAPLHAATTGLAFALASPAATAGIYAGHRQEAVVSTLRFEVTVSNPTAGPVRFSPFDLAAQSNGKRYRHHHESSHDALMLLAAGASERVAEVVAGDDTSPPGDTVEIRYGSDVLGTLPVSR